MFAAMMSQGIPARPLKSRISSVRLTSRVTSCPRQSVQARVVLSGGNGNLPLCEHPVMCRRLVVYLPDIPALRVKFFERRVQLSTFTGYRAHFNASRICFSSFKDSHCLLLTHLLVCAALLSRYARCQT